MTPSANSDCSKCRGLAIPTLQATLSARHTECRERAHAAASGDRGVQHRAAIGKACAIREALGVVGDAQPDSGDGQTGCGGVAERLVAPLNPGNAGGGKGYGQDFADVEAYGVQRKPTSHRSNSPADRAAAPSGR